jgi:general transcriptional corepressor CYC8
MEAEKYNKAYESYQQAVYRKGRDPVTWISIGNLYFQINQFKDALDAYSRAIQLDPYISTTWLNLGVLYETSNEQIRDAMDAYNQALELDPQREMIKERLELLSMYMQNLTKFPFPPPSIEEVHPLSFYQI